MPIDFDRASDRAADRFGQAARTIITRAPLVPRSVIAAVGLGAAFGVGLLVGGRDARADVDVNDAQDVLAVAADRSRSLEEARARLKLTFPAELATVDPIPVEKLTAAAVAAAKKSATGNAAALSKREEAPEPIEPPPAPAAPTPSPAASASAGEGTAGDVEERADRDVVDAGSPERRTPERLHAAIAKVVGESAAPSATSSAAPSAAASASASFALQVAAAPTRAGAEDMAAKLGEQGHKARVVEGDVGGKAVFRVRIGPFDDRGAADAYKAKLDKPAFVVRE